VGQWTLIDSKCVSRDIGEDVYLFSYRHTDEAVWVVMGWGRGDGLVPQLVQLSMGVGIVPDLGVLPVHWLTGGTVVSTRLLRSLNLSDAESQCRKAWSIDAGGAPSLPTLVSTAPYTVLDATAARALGFRSMLGLRAAVEDIKVSYKYVELVSQGVIHPVLRISNDLNMTEREVRTRLQQSRMAGYLDSGKQGKAAGSITEKAEKFSARLAEYLSGRVAE
jgi:hypothetical protein